MEGLPQELKDLIKVCNICGFDESDTLGVCIYLKENLEKEEIAYMASDVLIYSLFKASKSVLSPSDILSYINFIKRKVEIERYQYYPIREVVQYKGETTEELFKDEYYWLDTIFGYEEDSYLLLNEKDELKEYPAKDFINVVPTKIRYEGYDKKEDNSEGFEVGKEYYVKKTKGLNFLCDNDKTCERFEFFPLEFKPKRKRPLSKFKKYEALNCVQRAIEFGDVRALAKRITEDTEYISYNKEIPLKGKKEILEYFDNHRKDIYDQHCLVVCDIVKAKVDDEKSGCRKGDMFLLIEYEGLIDGTDPVYIECDDKYITKIEIKYNYPKCEKV